MKKIRAYVDWDDETKTHYYNDFEVVEKLPKINDIYYADEFRDERVTSIKRIDIDCEQGNDDVYNYDYYEIITDVYDKDYDEHDDNYYFVCTEIVYDDEDSIIDE